MSILCGEWGWEEEQAKHISLLHKELMFLIWKHDIFVMCKTHLELGLRLV